MSNFDFITYCNFSLDKFLIYTKYDGFVNRSNGNSNSLRNLECNKTKGILSNSSKKKIRKIIGLWSDAISVKKKVSGKNNAWKKKQITFITLTLPSLQLESDKENKRNLLNRFLIELQRKSNVSNYLWCAEKQLNGNIHYHLLSNSTVDYLVIRNIWNSILDDNNYIENYRQNQIHFHKDGFKIRTELLKNWNEEKQYTAYLNGTNCNWSNPNSTDIHSLEKINNIASYVTKYMTKSIDDELKSHYKIWQDAGLTDKEKDTEKWRIINEKYSHLLIDGKIWACSKSLQTLVKYSTPLDYSLELVINSTVDRDVNNKWSNEFCDVISNINLNEVKNKAPCYYNEFIKTNIENYNKIYSLQN